MTGRRLDVQKARLLSKVLAVTDIGLFALEARHVKGMENPTLGYAVNFEQVAWAKTNTGIVVVLPILVSLDHAPHGEQREKLAEIRVTTRIFFKGPNELTNEQAACVDDFVGITGWMHAWPYARADVQAISSRLGFPALTLPPMLAGATEKVSVRRLDEPALPLGAERSKAKRVRGSRKRS